MKKIRVVVVNVLSQERRKGEQTTADKRNNTVGPSKFSPSKFSNADLRERQT